MTIIRRGAAKVKHEARRAFLKPQLDVWGEVPGIHGDVTDDNREDLDHLCGLMADRGLFGRSTRERQRETVRRLLSELRGEDVGVEW